MRKALLALSLLVVWLAGAGGGGVRAEGLAQAQQAKLSVTARAGFGDTGAYLIGEWVPVRVTLDNPAGGTPRHVRVQIKSKGPDDATTTGLYAREVDLPTPSHKEVTLYTYSGSYTRRFRVQVVDGSTTIASVDVNADPYEPPESMIVGVISSDPSLFNALRGEAVAHIVNSLPQGGYSLYSSGYVPYTQYSSNASGLATVAHMGLDDIPAISEALDSVGAIILDDVDTGPLSAEQRAALEGWVSRGGMLVATARPGGADTTAGIASLLPVTVGGVRNVSSLGSLSEFVAAPSPLSGQWTIGDAQVRPDLAATSRVLVRQDGVPLLVVRDVGLGEVVYLGVSPAVTPLKNWDGNLPLIEKLLADHPLRLTYGGFLRFSPARGYYMGSLFETFGGMFALPGLDLPDPLLIGAFLLLYIIIVGPVNFIILRRMRRTELTWVTVPVLVLLFSVVAYLLAYQSKGGELVAIRANVVSTYPDAREGTLAQHFGLFSPVRRTYTLSLPADSVITEMNSYGYYQAGSDIPSPVIGGNPTTVNDVNIDTWSLKAYVAEHTEKVQSPVESKLSVGNNIIVGTIKNRTSAPLQDVALIRGDAVSYIGYLAPGQQMDVRLAVSSHRFDNSTPVHLLPPPVGVSTPQPGISYPYNGGQGNTAEQRTYNRKVELLSAALYPLVADLPPSDMSVVVLAWGPPLPTNFDVEGHTTSSEELNLWADVAPVGSASNEQPSLPSGSVPYSLYAPGNNPSLLEWNGSSTLSPPQNNPYAVPTAAPSVPPTVSQGFVTPTPGFIVPGSGFQVPAQTINIKPYADVRYRLPAGTKPDKLTLTYSIGEVTADSDIEVLAYNVNGGTWDTTSTIPGKSNSQSSRLNGTLSFPNPSLYTGPAGDVTIRLKPAGSFATLTDVSLNMELNGK